MNKTAKKAKNEYMKQWRKNNRDKIRASQERYWSKKAAEAKAAAAAEAEDIKEALAR